MRLVQVMIPTGKREAVLEALDAEGIDYALSDETSGREYTAVAFFPLPTGAVEPVLERLREAGLEREAYTVVVDAQTVVSDRFDALEAAYATDEERDDDRIAREELASTAREMAPETDNFLVLTAISAVVAVAGLLLDSPAVVVGSMVIAPLLGPAMGASVGTVVNDDDLFRRGVFLQVAGGVGAVAAAAGFAAVLRFGGVVPLTSAEVFATPEVAERLSTDILALPIALGAGIAGALSLSAGVSAALVGVMIAAALVPPTAVVGIGIAWGRPTEVVAAGTLVVLNFLAINFTAVATLWLRGYRPPGLFAADTAERATRRRLASLGVAVLLVSALLAGVTVAGAEQRAFESTAREETRSLLADTPGRLVELSVETDGVERVPTHLTVAVAVPPDAPTPRIAGNLADRLADDTDPFLPLVPATDSRLRVSVEFHTVERATSDPS